MIVGVDEARRQRPPARVDHPVGGLRLRQRHRAQCGDDVVVDQDIAREGRGVSVAIDDPRIANELAHHSASSSIRRSSTLAPAARSSGVVYSVDVVADAVDAGDEDHAGGADRRQDLRVVAGAARQPLHRKTEFLRDGFDARDKMRREADRLEAGKRAMADAQRPRPRRSRRRRRTGGVRPACRRSSSVLRRSTVITALIGRPR